MKKKRFRLPDFSLLSDIHQTRKYSKISWKQTKPDTSSLKASLPKQMLPGFLPVATYKTANTDKRSRQLARVVLQHWTLKDTWQVLPKSTDSLGCLSFYYATSQQLIFSI